MVTKATTFRVTTIGAIKAALDAYVVAHRDTLEAAFVTRPESYQQLPLAYIGKRYEDVRVDAAVRNRVLRTSVVLVDRVSDNAETMGRLDALVDGILDALTDAMRTLIDTDVNSDYGPLSITGVEPGEDLIEGVAYELEIIGLMAETQEGTGL